MENKKFYITWADGCNTGFIDYAGAFVSDDLAERADFFSTEEEAREKIAAIKNENPLCCYLDVAEYCDD